MVNSFEILKKISTEIGKDWKQKFNIFLNEDKGLSEEEQRMFEEFSESFREDVISGNKKVQTDVKKEIDNELLCNNLENYMKQYLQIYYAFSCIRAMDEENHEKTLSVIEEIFHKGVLRIDPELIDDYQRIGFKSKEAILRLVAAFSSICDYVVRRNLYRNSIHRAVYQNTRVSEEICEYITELIDQNFESLKSRMILAMLLGDQVEDD